MTNYHIQAISNWKKLYILLFFATSLLLTSTYSYAAECITDDMANKTKQNIQESSTEKFMKSTQQQQKVNNAQSIQSPQSPQQLQQGNEHKAENIRVITTLSNAADQLTGQAKVTVSFENENNKKITFQSNNKTITAEEEIVFPLTITKPTGKEQEPSTMEVCSVIEGMENSCDTILLVENQTKPYIVNLDLINFEEVEAVN